MLARLAILTILLPGGCAPLGRPAAAAPAAAPGPAAGAVPLLTLEGAPTSLGQVAGGRAALVSLWATWCEPCLAEFPALQRFAQRAPGDQVVAVAVAVGEPRPQVARFVTEHGLAYQHLVDEQFRFADTVGQKRVPTTLILDRAGQVTFTGGAFDEAALGALREMLGR